MLYLKKEELNNLLNFDEIYELTKRGFKLYSQGRTITPPYIDFSIPDIKMGHVHFKSGYITKDKYFTLKYSSSFWEESSNGLLEDGMFIVFNSKTGRQECIINDLGYLTDYRTGVAGAIATKTFARSDSKVVTVIGNGIQARIQIKSLMNVMDIQELNVWGRNSINVDKYISDMKEIYPNLLIEKYGSIEEAVKEADIVITTTYSDKPLIKSEWIREGTHITAVGSCGPNMQEIHENIFAKAKVFADSREMCSKYGEISHALQNNILNQNSISEIGEVLDSFRRQDEDITIVDLVGLGFQDSIIGSYVYEKALESKIGIELEVKP